VDVDTEVPATTSVPLRDRYNGFIAEHEIAWELGMAVLAIVFVVVGFADETPTITAAQLVLTVVFLAEFVTRFAAASHRTGYLRGHWIDLVALIPTTRAVRLLRLLRLLRLVRAFAGMYRAVGHLTSLAQHRGLALLFASWGAVMVICSIALYAAENGINKAITSPLDALWWGVSTLTTVGYGDVVPVTGEGRLAAAVLMLLGIGLFSAITATITSFLLHGAREPRSPGVRLRDLDELHETGLVTDVEYQRHRASILGEL
jgi:voltage-gated potassium channel